MVTPKSGCWRKTNDAIGQIVQRMMKLPAAISDHGSSPSFFTRRFLGSALTYWYCGMVTSLNFLCRDSDRYIVSIYRESIGEYCPPKTKFGSCNTSCCL